MEVIKTEIPTMPNGPFSQAVRHGDVVVTETAAICAYLADAFPAARLAPPSGHKLRAPYYRWLFFTAGPVEYAVSNMAVSVGFAAHLVDMFDWFGWHPALR